MSFDWNDLRYFISVARTGRLTTAAPRMGTDHATVSRRIRALEESLGAALFNRSPRGYTLTDMGERLLRYAEDMETTSAHIQNDIAGERFSLSGVVRVGAPDGLGHQGFPFGPGQPAVFKIRARVFPAMVEKPFVIVLGLQRYDFCFDKRIKAGHKIGDFRR